jgi:thiamine monophosphate kinase
MKESLTQKVVPITNPGAIVDNAAFTTAEIDTLGFRFLTIYVMLGALDIALAAFKATQSDTSGSGHADITGADFAAALPAATDDNKIYAIHINLLGKKRYIDLTLTGGDGSTGTYAVAWAVLSRAEEAPNSAAERGVTGAELFA